MACEECHSFPHLPGCPNGPDTTEQCECCGAKVHPDTLVKRVCERCRRVNMTAENLYNFAQDNSLDFLFETMGIVIDGDDAVKELVAIHAIDILKASLYIKMSDFKSYATRHKEDWADFCLNC